MQNISLGYLNINERGKRYVNDALDRNRLSRGKYTDRFEMEFGKEHGCAHSVFCNSGTSALQIAVAALKERHGYKDGDEILVPSVTFIATSNVVIQNNLKPVFVDVDPETFNIDVTKIEAKITARMRAIIPVHLFGLPCDMHKLMPLARKHGLQVIEDSCETMFAKCHGLSVGAFGDMACFSTYVAHLLVGGVGGLVTTNDMELAEMCRSLMAHGRDGIYLSIDDDDDGADEAALMQMIERRFKFDRIGYSYRATELEAAIALSELEQWEPMIAKRRHNAAYLIERLRQFEGVQLPVIPDGLDHSFMMFPMAVREGVNRETLLLHLEKAGIETRYMLPLLSQPVYRKLFPGALEQYPVAKHLEKSGFAIGIHQGLSDSDLDYVVDNFSTYFKAAKRNVG